MLNLLVVVSALGYFVDIYDLLLFSIVRVASLKSLGVPPDQLLSVGVNLINMQMAGMLIGGIVWGVLGDKKGRLSVLFGSILLYSLANIANAFAATVPQYAALRFLAGVGLAGELGAAITLVSETMSRESRGYGTSIVAGVGILGAVFAAFVGQLFSWRVAFGIGGAMGLLLLILRVSLVESGMYHSIRESQVKRGDLRMLFSPPRRLAKYLSCIFVGTPVWFIVGILMTFSPELAAKVGVQGEVSAGTTILFGYAGLSIGDFFSGFLSQLLRSRKRVLSSSLFLCLILSAVYLHSSGLSVTGFYILSGILGMVAGYWAIFVTTAAEHFGTNLRATVTTTVPNFVRGSVVLLTIGFKSLTAGFGLIGSATLVGGISFAIAFISLALMEETYGKDLDYLET
jgi:putative MFS transporter